MRTVMTAVLVPAFVYYAHRLLQLQYYRHCKADLIRVVLFRDSVVCTHASSALQLVEVAYNQLVRHLLAQALGSLRGDLFGSSAAGGGAGAGMGMGFGMGFGL